MNKRTPSGAVSSSTDSLPMKRTISITQRTNNRPISQSSSQTKKRLKSYLDDPDCISIRKSLINEDENKQTFEQIETPQLLLFLSHLREYTQACALSENYKEAKKSRDLCNKVKAELRTRGTIHNNLQDQKNEVDEVKMKFEETWKKKREDYQNETEAKIREIDEQHSHEMRRFERIWNEEMPHKYRKPSTELLQLKQIEKNLVISGKIDEAEEIHLRAERLAIDEALDAQRLLSIDYECAKNKLFEQQKKEKTHLLDERERYRQILEHKHELAKMSLDNRNNVVSNKAEKIENKLIIMKSVSTQPTQIPKEINRLKNTLLPPLVPPNDRRYIELKKKRNEELSKLQKSYQQKNIEQFQAIYSDDTKSPKVVNESESSGSTFVTKHTS